MAETVKDGGPAFPHRWEESYQIDGRVVNTGMSLRDYFAGQILASSAGEVPPSMFDDYAKAAYRLADAMLKARG